MIEEARRWVADETLRLRRMSFEELLALRGAARHQTFETARGETLMGEVLVEWDDRRSRQLRVLVDVCQPAGGRARSLAKEDFILASDGSFVGE